MAYLCIRDFSNVKFVPWLRKVGKHWCNWIWSRDFFWWLLSRKWHISTHTIYIKIMKLYAYFTKTQSWHTSADLQWHILKWLVLYSGTQRPPASAASKSLPCAESSRRHWALSNAEQVQRNPASRTRTLIIHCCHHVSIVLFMRKTITSTNYTLYYCTETTQ